MVIDTVDADGWPIGRLLGALERIANAQERIAAALEGPPAAAHPTTVPALTGCENGVHPPAAVVQFGSDDEWECKKCGFRSEALVNA